MPPLGGGPQTLGSSDLLEGNWSSAMKVTACYSSVHSIAVACLSSLSETLPNPTPLPETLTRLAGATRTLVHGNKIKENNKGHFKM